MSTTIEVHEKTDVILPSKNGPEASTSAVSWCAIFAGATGAAALSLILLLLGSGLGFSVMSPWANEGASAKTLGISGILWLTLTSIAASGIGGYLAGRLRSRWAGTHSDEVYFRDTAHGFLAWAIATLFTAALLTTTIGAIIGGGIKAGAKVASGAIASAAIAGASSDSSEPNLFGSDGAVTGYFIDSLFRGARTTTNNTPLTTSPPDSVVPPQPAYPENTSPVQTSPTTSMPTAEVARIFINGLRNNALPEDDARYLGQIVASHTDLTQAEAELRVKDTFTKWQTNLRDAEATAKEAADEARKTGAYISLWFFIALLIGAFTASWLATYGGRRRDM